MMNLTDSSDHLNCLVCAYSSPCVFISASIQGSIEIRSLNDLTRYVQRICSKPINNIPQKFVSLAVHLEDEFGMSSSLNRGKSNT